MQYAESFKRLSFITHGDVDVLVALLSTFPISGFEESGNKLDAFIPSRLCDADTLSRIGVIAANSGIEMRVSELAWENWNSLWESGFDPVRITDRIRIKASFHTPDPSYQFEIVIDPRMAFGTGHHITTSMMLARMDQLEFKSRKVLDFGCGTGVLSILASMLGASETLAIDHDPHAVENARDNCKVNKVENVTVKEAGIKDISGKWDWILANINRDVIEGSLGYFKHLLDENGCVLASGILAQEIDLTRTLVINEGFTIVHEERNQGWGCLQFKA